MAYPSVEADRTRSLPARVWLVVALQAALTLGAIFLFPTFQEPDEQAHVDYVLAYRHGDWIYAPGARLYQSGVLSAFVDLPSTQFKLHVGGRPARPRADRLSFDQRGTSLVSDHLPNQMVQHPPLYYATAAAFSYLIPDFSSQHSDIQVFWLRVLSLLLMLPVPILVFLAARQLTGDEVVGLVAALIPLTMPGYLRTGASVTNDSLAALFGASLLYALARVATGDITRRTAIFTGLLWAGGLLTKGFALTLPPVIVLAYLVGAHGSLRSRIRAAAPAACVCLGIGAIVAGWWWIRNRVLYGAVQPNGFGRYWGQRQVLYGPDRPGATELGYFKQFFYLAGQRMWGSLGLIDVPKMEAWKPVVVVVIFLLLVFAGIAVGFARASAPRWAAVSFFMPSLLVVVLMYAGGRQLYMHNWLVGGVQSRYLTPAIGGATICAGVALRRIADQFSRWLPLTVALAAVVFDAGAAVVVLSRQMSARSLITAGLGRQVRDGLQFVGSWSPWSPPVTAALGALALAATAFVVVVFAVHVWMTRPGPALAGTSVLSDRSSGRSASGAVDGRSLPQPNGAEGGIAEALDESAPYGTVVRDHSTPPYQAQLPGGRGAERDGRRTGQEQTFSDGTDGQPGCHGWL